MLGHGIRMESSDKDRMSTHLSEDEADEEA